MGRFKLVSLLGQGAMGKVFRATDTQLQRDVALKVLPTRKDGQPTVRQEQFIREARAAANLDHAHIVRVYEINQEGPYIFIAMELLEGGDLGSIVDATGPMDVARACQLVAEAAEGLSLAHGVGVIHRDVKPTNLMLSRQGRCKLVDFGLADLGDANDPFRLPGKAIGTAHYMAPEVVRKEAGTVASDVYSLGCTLYHLLAGKPPFAGRSLKDVLQAHLSEPPPSLRKLRSDLPESLVQTIHRAMAKDPAERFADAASFGKALRLHTVPVGSGVSDPSLSGVMPQVQRGKLVVLWGGVTVSVAALLVAALFLMGHFGKKDSLSTPPLIAQPVRGPESAPSAGAGSGVGTAPVSAAKGPLPTGVIDANDRAAISALAQRNAQATIRGTVQSAATSGSGKVFTIVFVGNGRDDFTAVCFPRLYDAMAGKFGGTHGSGLTGRTIDVSGQVSTFKGAPQIVIENTDQVRVVMP